MKQTNGTVETRVIHFLQKYNIEKGSSVIAACSGGPDSITLVSVLAELESYDFKIICAYYDHGLRERTAIEGDINAVSETAGRYGLKMETGASAEGRLKNDAERDRLSLEEAARNARYSFLYGLLERYQADFVATGHTIDDNAETVLMRLLRNAGTGGLSGIPERNDRIIRPLSMVRREDVEAYVLAHGLRVSEDETNSENVFLRNRVRNRIMPAVREVIPEYRENLKQISEKIRIDNEYISGEAAKELKWKAASGGFSIDKEIFYAADRVLRIRSVTAMINRMLPERRRIRYAGLESALHDGIPEKGRILLETSDFRLEAGRDHIFLTALVNHFKKSYLLCLEADTEFFFDGFAFSVVNYRNRGYLSSESGGTDGGLEFLSVMPAVARTFREGDRIDFERGSKSLKKLFNEWGVDNRDRDRILLLEDRCGVCAVAGSHLGYGNRAAFRKAGDDAGFERFLLTSIL